MTWRGHWFTLLEVIAFAVVSLTQAAAAVRSTLPDGRVLTPVGFTVPVEGFASSLTLSPEGRLLAVLSQDGGAIDIIEPGEHMRLVDRLSVPGATGMVWTDDGLFVTRGYSGIISRFAYTLSSPTNWKFRAQPDIVVGGLLNGIAEDPVTHRIAVAKTANQEVDIIDNTSGNTLTKFNASGQPFSVGLTGDAIIATIYNGDHVDLWDLTSSGAANNPRPSAAITTGPHPTALLLDGAKAYVANADGHDVAVVDIRGRRVERRYELGISANPPPGQTPSGMALANDHKQLYVAESGFNDVAVVDIATGKVLTRIPTAWYPMSVAFFAAATTDKNPRIMSQLFVASAQGLGTNANPGGEWNGTYTGLVEHVIVDASRFAPWTAMVKENDHLSVTPGKSALPPIKHFVFIVKENKHFDEEFGDEHAADADPTLLLYGRKYTPNSHAIAEAYTLFDDFMGDGESSNFGHSWTTQAMANDYLERNIHTSADAAADSDPEVAYSIWPRPLYGEDKVPISFLDFDWYANLSTLPRQPRINVSAVFGPRGEFIDALQAHHVSFRVYGEQMTMRSDGSIDNGLVSHAARGYPGAHINFDVLDSQRAKIFLADIAGHGLAQYSYVTLPTDHTAGTKPGFYTPASYVASNDAALGQIIAGLSQRPDWRDTVVFVTEDDPQGTGDHVDSHRMPAFMIGPWVRRNNVDHTRYSIPAVLRTVEALYGISPLNIYDAAANPMADAFARQPIVTRYHALAANIPMQKNPGVRAASVFDLDGPDARALIPEQEWASINGPVSLRAHLAYMRALGTSPSVASVDDEGVDADDQ